MISMTIVSVMLVIIFSAFRVGTRAWEKGEKDIIFRQRYRIVPELIRRQLTSVYLPDYSGKNNRPAGRFIYGDDSFLNFISRKSLIPGSTSGMVRVLYRISEEGNGEQSLSFYEKNIIALSDDINKDDIEDDDWYTLIPRMKDCIFEYTGETASAKGADSEIAWISTWEPKDKKRLPKAVRILFQADENSKPIRIIVPVSKGSGDEKTS